MTKPRTIAGQAALSGMRPQLKRALAHIVLAIEKEAAAPYIEALRRLAPSDLDPSVRDDQPLAQWPVATVRAGDYRAARALLLQAEREGAAVAGSPTSLDKPRPPR